MTGEPKPPSPPGAPSQPRTARQWRAYAEDCLARGASSDRVAADIAAQGCPWDQAEAAVHEARAGRRRSANAVIGCSAAAALVGFLVTVGTFIAATETGGGTYLIWWGPMLLGVIGIIIGLARKLRAS
jgi:ferric-dicitrate binding protein FerR (iron transport regulator)